MRAFWSFTGADWLSRIASSIYSQMNRHKGNAVVEKERFMSAGATQSLDQKNIISIEGCPRNRRMLIVVSQFCLVALTYYCSFLLRLDFSLDMATRLLFLQTLPVVLALK